MHFVHCMHVTCVAHLHSNCTCTYWCVLKLNSWNSRKCGMSQNTAVLIHCTLFQLLVTTCTISPNHITISQSIINSEINANNVSTCTSCTCEQWKSSLVKRIIALWLVEKLIINIARVITQWLFSDLSVSKICCKLSNILRTCNL